MADRNNGGVAFTHKLASALLLLLLVGVVFLLALEWGRSRFKGSTPQEEQKTVLARASSTEPVVSNVPADLIEPPAPQIALPKENSKPTTVSQQQQNSNQAAPIVPPVTTKAPGARPAKRVPRPASSPGQHTVRLADGRAVTFGGVTYGLDHSYAHPRAAAKPAAASRDGTGMSAISIKTASPSLVVWLHCKEGKGSFLEADFISVIDEAGREGELSNPSSIFNPAELETVGAWQILNFPRRDPKIGIRFYSRDSSYKFHPLAEFWATNPAPRKYEVWSADAGPITKTIGNTDYRFMRLLPEQAPPAGAQSSTMPPSEWTTAIFQATTRGEPAMRWRVQSIALSDATGNTYTPDNGHFSDVGDYLVFSFNRSFWSSETAGKLRAEFTRASGFSPSELVTFRNVRIPSGTNSVAIRTQRRAGDVTLKVENLQRHMPPVRMGEALWNLELIAAVVPPTAGVHVCLAEVRDQVGQDIGAGITHNLANGRQSFLFHTGPQSMSLNITFAVQKSQVVEFVPSLQKDAAVDQFSRAGPLPDR